LTPKFESQLAVIVPTRGKNSNILKCIESYFLEEISLIVVDQGVEEDRFNLHAVYGPKLKYIWCPGDQGVSKAMNVGLDNLSSEIDLVTLANENSIYSGISIQKIRVLFSTFPDLGVVCGAYTFGNGKILYPGIGFLTKSQILRPIEASYFFSKKCFDFGIRFNEHIGTGSPGIAWSGEGPEILYRIQEMGLRVYGLNEITSKDLRKEYTHSWKTEIKYGAGFTLVAKMVAGNRWTLLRILTPAIRVFIPPKGGKTIPIATAFGMIWGRFLGYILPPSHFDLRRE